ncbi:4-(cytidine 5'-diphospho)-2-C-methyl-D-erythritol kinase [Rugosibacter aromaticivorans]|nr:4-(cytidine 5'-diphospho)-2-C-methyl-D-erythritol kinase [Rugosibacter aromaticivorans]
MMNDWSSEWFAPAKINLFLHVIGRRADGYHLLQTVFRFLDVGDRIRCEPRQDGRIVLATPLPGVTDENHLAVRAAQALRAAASMTASAAAALGVTLHVDKRLPLGGGLGGGSSDAATTLIALNHLWRTSLDRPQLKRIALTLGADVPIFIHGHTAFAEGVGDLFTDVMPPPAWYLVLVPPVAVPTAQIFAASDLRHDTPAMAASAWHSGTGRNDLEAVAAALYPEVARHLDWLRAWGDARMSGSGGCCFVAFDTAAAAYAAHAALPPSMQGFVASGIDQHPLALI